MKQSSETMQDNNKRAPLIDARNLVCETITNSYMQEFVDICALTVSITESYPEQSNNEIRNALTHLARALEIEKSEEMLTQVNKAKDHIERGKKDCLKMCIIEMHGRIRSMLATIEFKEGIIPNKFNIRTIDLEKRRKEAAIKETRNDSVGSFTYVSDMISINKILFIDKCSSDCGNL